MTWWWTAGAFALWAALVLGLRTAVAVRRTGDSGIRGITSPPGTAGWWGGVLFVAAIGLAVVGIAAAAADVATVPLPASRTAATAGWVLVLAGTVATVAAQLGMGSSWRVGVDPDERTALVTGGPFALVRNPIFTAMVTTAVGFALLLPNAASLAALLALIVAIELQVRVVEEPHLLAAHGDRYRHYAARVGRFLPGIGRLR